MKNALMVASAMLTFLTGMILPDALPVQETEVIDEYGYCFIDYACPASYPSDLKEVRDVKERKVLLIETLLPLILKANEDVLAKRVELLRMRKGSFYLDESEIRFIEGLAAYYRVTPGDHRLMIDELLARVDVLPPSLVLAQAAIESGWGRSRFAAEGNNVFGLRGSRGRGLIPRGRGPYEKHTVRAFSSLQSCIDFYMWNINTNPEYEDLRQIRRQRQSLCDPIELAQGLKTYSEMGCDYVDDVVELIRNNNLTLYDRYRLNTRDLYAFESRRSQDLL